MKLRSMFIVGLMICLPFFGMAQDPVEPDNSASVATEIGAEVSNAATGDANPGDLPPGPTAVPIDGGLSFLLAAGVGYGMKKYRDHKRIEKKILLQHNY